MVTLTDFAGKGFFLFPPFSLFSRNSSDVILQNIKDMKYLLEMAENNS